MTGCAVGPDSLLVHAESGHSVEICKAQAWAEAEEGGKALLHQSRRGGEGCLIGGGHEEDESHSLQQHSLLCCKQVIRGTEYMNPMV